ncbi:MAG: hypothetical protein J6S16_00870 [Bacteroidales bacterium]|nr:hypothetical protein [Bacteroidales bacterium]
MKKILITVVAVLVASVSFAQTNHRFSQVYSFGWQSSVPLGAQADFISRAGFNGADFNFGFFVTDNIAVGADFAWGYNHKSVPAEIYQVSENCAVYAALYKTTQTIPMKAQFKYLFNPEGFVKVYAAAGLGATSYVEYTQIQEYEFSNSSWGFLMSPEVGVYIPFGKHAPWGANVVAGYNWATNNAQNLYFNVGLYFSVF